MEESWLKASPIASEIVVILCEICADLPIGLTFSQHPLRPHPPHEDVGLCKGVAFSDLLLLLVRSIDDGGELLSATYHACLSVI